MINFMTSSYPTMNQNVCVSRTFTRTFMCTLLRDYFALEQRGVNVSYRQDASPSTLIVVPIEATGRTTNRFNAHVHKTPADLNTRKTESQIYSSVIRCSCQFAHIMEKHSGFLPEKLASMSKLTTNDISLKIVKGLHKGTRMVPTHEEIVEQAKILCKEYVSNKLKKVGIFDNELAVHFKALVLTTTTTDASEEIQHIGAQLESMYPELYRNVFKQLNISFVTEDVLRRSYTMFADQLCRGGLHWGKVVALFAMAGAFAEDCIHIGHPEYVHKLVETFGNVTSKRLASWIAVQGGWSLPNVMHNLYPKHDGAQLWLLGCVGAIIGFIIALTVTVSM